MKFTSSTRESRRPAELLVLLAILASAAAVRSIGIMFGLPHVYYPDEAVLVNHAMAFGTGDFNPHYFIYPSLYMYVLFIIYGVTYVVGLLIGAFSSTVDFTRLFFDNATPFFLPGRVLAAVSGVACVGVAYEFGRRAYSVRVGLVAATILAFSVGHVEFSHYVKTHVPAGLLVMVAVWLAWTIQKGDARYTRYLAAGAVAGAAAAIVYHAGLVLISVVAAHFLRDVDRSRGENDRWLSPKLLAACGASIVAFVIGTPFALLDWRTFISDLNSTGAMYLQGGLWEGSAIFPVASLSSSMGQPLGVLAWLGLSFVLVRRRRVDLLVLSQPLFLALFLALFPIKERHHMLVAFGPIAVLSASFLDTLVVSLVRVPRRQIAVLALVTLVLIAAPAKQSIDESSRRALPDTRTVAKQWVEENIDRRSKLLMDSGKYYLSAMGPPLPLSYWTLQQFIVRADSTSGGSFAERDGTRRITYSSEGRYFREQLQALGNRSGYDVIQILHDDGSSRADILSLEEYQTLGVQYAIVSSYAWRTYAAGGDVAKHHPEKAARYRRVYETLQTQATLVKEFQPVNGLVGPVLRIYRVS